MLVITASQVRPKKTFPNSPLIPTPEPESPTGPVATSVDGWKLMLAYAVMPFSNCSETPKFSASCPLMPLLTPPRTDEAPAALVSVVFVKPRSTVPLIVTSAIAPVTAANAAIATRVFFISIFSKG